MAWQPVQEVATANGRGTIKFFDIQDRDDETEQVRSVLVTCTCNGRSARRSRGPSSRPSNRAWQPWRASSSSTRTRRTRDARRQSDGSVLVCGQKQRKFAASLRGMAALQKLQERKKSFVGEYNRSQAEAELFRLLLWPLRLDAAPRWRPKNANAAAAHTGTQVSASTTRRSWYSAPSRATRRAGASCGARTCDVLFILRS